MILLLGTVTAGAAYNEKLQMTHAVREGARYGATIPAGQTFTNSASWAENVRDLIVERSGGDLTVSQVCVALVQGSGGTLAVVSYASPGKPATWYSTGRAAAPGVPAIAPGQPCTPGQTYPLTGSDNGRRVQVTAHRPAQIELLATKIDIILKSNATAKSESSL